MRSRVQNTSTVKQTESNFIDIHKDTCLIRPNWGKERRLTNERLSFSYKKYTWEIRLGSHIGSTLSGSACQRPWHAPEAGHRAGSVLRRGVGIPPFSSRGRQLRAGRGNGRDLKWLKGRNKYWVCEGLCWDGFMTKRFNIHLNRLLRQRQRRFRADL